MPKFLKHYDTEARDRLARLHEARAEAAAEAHDARGRVNRLSALAESANPIRAKLAALDASEASAFASWSRDPSLPVPAPDTVARTDLQRELSEAQSKADAAGRAMTAMAGEVDAAFAKASAAEGALNFAAAHVGLEELAVFADEARAAVAKLADARMKGQALARVLGNVSLASGPSAPGFAEYSAAYAAAGEGLRIAFELPRISEAEEYDFLAKAGRLLMALKGDAAARLES